MRIGRQEIPRSFFVNASAGALALFLAVWLVRDWLDTGHVPPCSQRFVQGTVFSLEAGGGLLVTPTQLQGRLAGSDQGLRENLEIVRTEGTGRPADSAMRVRLATLSSDGQSEQARFNGIGFHWVPRRMPPEAASACLTYSIRAPATFDYGVGGVLPGLTGGRDGEEHVPGAQTISVRPRWLNDGRFELRLTGDDQQTQIVALDSSRARLGKGRWTRLDFELHLNSPGARDGAVRVWIDDELALQKGGLRLRSEASSKLHGIQASIGYNVSSRDGGRAPALGEGPLDVTPFELRWPEPPAARAASR